MNSDEFLAVLAGLYGENDWPKPLHLLKGYLLVRNEGLDAKRAALRVRTAPRYLQAVLDAADPVEAALGANPAEIERKSRVRAFRTLGQLLVGRAAEAAFETIYNEEMESGEMELRDLRESRSDTDYRLYNGDGRPIYRLNIKFHGALFANARAVVGLEPEDCFALATYKIRGALKKQEAEHLPYVFVVVGERSLTGEQVGRRIAGHYIDTAALYYQAPKAKRKRDLEDRLVEQVAADEDSVFQHTYRAIQKADWYILSARRADRLLHESLYERVFALSVPSFARAYSGAEVDMHFSLSADLTPLRDFLRTLRNSGHPVVVSKLERGDY
ncbi:MAG: hypothetical protein OXG83_08375 [Acidobacteria bacterium]|nr:hypothetical protein [Acidobacteriota bacterium]